MPPRPSEVPKPIAVLMLQSACDIGCAFCITEPFRALGFEEACAQVDRLAAEGARSLVLGGGEPLLWRHDLFALARRAKDLGLLVQVGTNGVRLPAGFERLGCIDRWVLPLESADAAVHDRLRVHSSSHHAVILDRLEACRRARRSVTVSTVVTRWNREGLPALGRRLAGYAAQGGNVHAWHLYRFLAEGRGGARHADDLWLSREAYDAACAVVRAAPLPFPVYLRPDMYRSRSVRFVEGAGRGPEPGKPAWRLRTPVAGVSCTS